MERNHWIPAALCCLGFTLLAAGFLVNALWRGIVPAPTLFLGALLLAPLVPAFALGRFLRCAMATALLLLWLLALACFAGFAACLAVVLVALAATGIGSLLVPVEVPARISLCILVGIAILCGIDGWLLPFHIHFRPVYVIAMFVAVFLRWHVIVSMLRTVQARWSGAVMMAPGMAVLSLTAIGAMSTFAWLPTLDFDSLAYHLNLPAQLFTLGYYQMNIATNIWALSPWAADVLQAIAWIAGGVLARGAVDALWAGLSLVLIWTLCEELGLRPSLRWLAVALYAAIPTIGYTLFSMQTEGPTAAVIAALALLIQHVKSPGRRDLLLAAVLFALLLALKVSNLMFAGPLGSWLLWRWHARLPWRMVPCVMLVILLLAGASYFYAWCLTGNPVLPVFNGVFHSPCFSPINWHDNRWNSGFRWDIVWRLVFHSSDYKEGGADAPIVVLIALGGSVLVALARPVSRPLALVALACLLLPLYEIQYSRYAIPSMALLIPAMLCGAPSGAGQSRRRRWVETALCLLVVISLAYVSGISWQTKAGILQTRVTGGRAEAIDQFTSLRRMVQVVEQRYGNTARVLNLDPEHPFAAEFAGRAFADNWFDPQLQRWVSSADSDPSGQAWMAVFGRTGVNLVITARDSIPSALMTAITRANGRVVFEGSQSLLWQLRTGKPGVIASTASHGVSVSFDAESVPPAQSLVDASVTLRCNPEIARKGHIVVGWMLGQQGRPTYSHYGWAHCLQNGTAHASIHLELPDRVMSMKLVVHPEPALDMGLAVIDSYASLRRDLMGERDLSRHARDLLEFKKNKSPLGPVAP